MSLIYLIILIIAALVLERLSSRNPFDRLRHEMTPDKGVLEPEEEFSITTTISNGKSRPVLFLKLEENVPPGLVLLDSDSPDFRVQTALYNSKTQAKLMQTLYVLPRQKLSRTLRVRLDSRGRYLFHDGKMMVGDLLGFEENVQQLSYIKEVVVLPRRISAPDTDAAFGNYLGDISVRRFILSDPILTAGFREYSGREPMKDISWPASLRQGKLMVKQFDYTAELTATVLLSIDGGNPEEIELCYSLARHICEQLEDKRVSYSFLTGAYVANSAGRWTFMGEGLGDKHLSAILEGLGRASHESLFSFEKLLSKIGPQNGSNKAFILVCPPLKREDKLAIARFENRVGGRVFVVEADTESFGKNDAESASSGKEAAA